jgi:ribosomal protein S12 methylthiotransferase accessory factor
MGITRVANVTGLDRIGVPVVMVCRPNARSLAVSQGKGLDLDSAMASGLMEAAELYHAEHIALPLKLGCQAELLATHPLVEVGRLARVAGGRFNPHLVMLWIEGIDLFSGAPRWVPFESVRANFTLPPPPGSGCFDCSSNGLASGNTLAEAVCHAICEIVERDATALWNRLSRKERSSTGIDLASVEDTACRGVLEKLERADFGVAAWETTSDIGIPAFFALISDRRDPSNHHGIGAAAHRSRDVALLKALVEAAQVRTTYISGTRDDLSLDEYGEAGRDSKRQAAKRLLAGHAAERRMQDVPDLRPDSPAAELGILLARLKAVGIAEAVAVDLSKEELGLAVVRVVIPGLEGPDDHAAYVPGERARRVRDRN